MQRVVHGMLWVVLAAVALEFGCGRQGFTPGGQGSPTATPTVAPGTAGVTVEFLGTGQAASTATVVTSSLPGINCPPTCQFNFPTADGVAQVELAAIGTAYVAGWTGCNQFAGNSCAVVAVANTNRTVVVHMQPAGTVLAIATYGGLSSSKVVGVVVLPSSGDAVVTGFFQGVTFFGNSAGNGLPATVSSSNGSPDIFVARYNPALDPEWVRRFGGALSDSAGAIARSSTGGIVITGSFNSQNVAFARGIDLLTAGNKQTFFAAGLDSTGTVHWAFTEAGGQANGAGLAATFNKSDQLCINEETLAGNGVDYMINALSVNTAGVAPGAPAAWPVVPGSQAGGAQNTPFAVGSDSAGDFWIAGATSSATLKFGGPFTLTNPFANSSDGWVVGLDSAGNPFDLFDTSRLLGGAPLPYSKVQAIGVLPVSGDLVLAGFFDNQPPPAVPSAVAFVARTHKNGQQVWVKQWKGPTDHPTSLAIGTDGRIIVAGGFTGTQTFGPDTLTSQGQEDIFVTRLDPVDGHFVWARSFGGPQNDEAEAVAIGPGSFVYAAGFVTSAGVANIALMRLAP